MPLSASDLQAIKAGQARIERARAELAFMHNGSRHAPQAWPQQPQPGPEAEAITAPKIAPAEGLQIAKPAPSSKRARTAEIWPLMGIHAQDTKHAGAWRLYVLAYTLDHGQCNHADHKCTGGSGKIERATLQEAAEKLGVKRSTFFYWLADARAAHILNGGGEYLYLASQEKLQAIFLLNSIDRSKAIIPLKLLFRPGWKSIVWAAYLKANHHKAAGTDERMKPVYKGKMISAKTLEDLTGVEPRTQRRYKEYISSSRPNIGITDIRGSRETATALNKAAKDNDLDRHYFPYNDSQQQDPAGIKDYRRVIACTLPARRTVSDKAAMIGARGRRQQISAAILSGLRLVTVCNYSGSNYPTRPAQATAQAANREARKNRRRYYQTKKQINRLLETMQFREWTPEETREAYILRARGRRAGVWDRVGV